MSVKALDSSKVLVLKIGSVLLSDIAAGTIKQGWIDAFAADVKELVDMGKHVLVVSSGGVALGRSDLGIATDIPPMNIPLAQKQAASAIGQYHMFHGYHSALAAQGIKAAQVLLTIGETENRRMYLNARETLKVLMERGIVPIINENDTVSTGELRFGDNDRLAVRVAQMIEADLVVLLSTTDGLYTDNPDEDSKAELIPIVKEITEKHIAMAGEAVAGLSTGGMKSKVEAAISATRAGLSLVITDGRAEHSLAALMSDKGEKASTIFIAQENAPNARKRWIQSHLQPKGAVYVDAGALGALKSGKSLLPIGVSKVEGAFDRGDVITVHDADGTAIGIGISAYSSVDAVQIIGHRSSQIADILGYLGRDELIHRNDMALQV